MAITTFSRNESHLNTKLQNLNQTKYLHVVIAPPRSVSTAFTRALCKAADADGVHELAEGMILNYDDSNADYGGGRLLERFSSNKDSVILKEMPHTVKSDGDKESHQREYRALMKVIIGHAAEPFVFINVNPAMVFLSMMRVSLEVSYRVNMDVLKETINRNKDYTLDSFKALEDLQTLIHKQGKSYIILGNDDIKKNPEKAVQDVLNEWELASDYLINPPLLAPVVSCNKKGAEIAEYVMAHPDRWVAEEDKKAEYFKASERMSEQDETSQRIGKIQDFFYERDHEKVSRKLYEALRYIENNLG